MNLGKRILEIRKENKMSQDDFAELFNVTRQTISSWENSKSYPDIEMLVKISDKFNVSLDILLREDMKMVKDIDNNVKKNPKLKIIIRILSIVLILLVAVISITILNNSIKQREAEEQAKRDELRGKEISTNLNYLGFVDKDGIGFSNIEEDGVIYSVYAKMPTMLEEHISARQDLENQIIMYDFSGEKVGVTYTDENVITIYCDRDGNLINEKQNKNYTEIFNNNKEKTTLVIKRMVELFDEIYK